MSYSAPIRSGRSIQPGRLADEGFAGLTAAICLPPIPRC